MDPEYGQCVHRIVQHPTNPDMLYQQNHCGIYKSNNAGEDWVDIQHNLPSEFGFPIALDTYHPDTIFTVVEDDTARRNIPTPAITGSWSPISYRQSIRWRRLLCSSRASQPEGVCQN